MSQSITRFGAASPRAGDTPGAEAGQYLSFRLGDAAYALPILQVQEIRRSEAATRLPGNPASLRGVINLRGTVLPVLELGELLQLPKGPDGERPVMIVATVNGRHAGLLVDAVSDVVALGEGDLRPVPAMLPADHQALSAIASIGGEMVLLLDLSGLLGMAPPCTTLATAA